MKNDKKNTPATPKPNTTTGVDLAQLTPAQILQLTKQLREARKHDLGDHETWLTVVDPMLHETEGEGFRYTTSDILAAVQAKGVVPMQISSDTRIMQIKRIQTRKQLLEKKRGEDGKPLHKVGYKPSANSFGPLDAVKIVAWLDVPANLESVTVAQAEAIAKAIAHII